MNNKLIKVKDGFTQGGGFFQNIFGTIANSSSLGRLSNDLGFFPLDGSNNIARIKGDQAVWLGLKIPIQQLYAYDYCYPLASVIDRLAEADITGTLEIVIPGGKGKDNISKSEWAKRMMKLLKRPNALQSWEQFRAQQVVYKKIFGFCPVLPIVPTGFDPSEATAMVNLPPWLFSAVPTSESFIGIGTAIKEYRCSILGMSIVLQPDQVMILEDGLTYSISQNYLLPQSKLVGLDMAVSNLCAAMEADNVLLKKKGPLGFISHDAAATKDSVAGYLPMTVDEKEEMQDQLSQYGMSWGQFQYVISRTAMKWNPMSFNVGELGTKETILEASRAICQRFGFPYVLFQDSDATFSNQESAHKKLYDNNVVPNNCKDMAKYNLFFNAEESNCRIYMDYSDLAVFQEDELNAGRAHAALSTGLQVDYINDIITKNQWLQALQMDTIGPEGDKYYSESNLKVSKDAAKLSQAQAAAQLPLPPKP